MKRHLLTWLLLLTATIALADQRHADVGDLALTSGDVIEDCRVGFRTLGELNADKSNVIVFPTWFRGTTGDLVEYGIIGPGGLADTDRYHVVAIDALANGVSCSPSNTEGDYPAIATSDMVRSQHRLLTEHLGLNHVRAVMGISMGGMQTFAWIGEYPDFMDKAVSLDGSPRMTSYDLLQWHTHRDVVRKMQAGGYENAEIGAMASQLSYLTLYTPDYFVAQVPADKWQDFVNPGGQAGKGFHPDDYVAQLDAMINHNVLGSGEASKRDYVSRVEARVLIVGVKDDHMVNPTPARLLAPLLEAEYVAIESNCGHVGSSCETDRVKPRVARFLDE